MTEKKHYPAIDILRLLAILAVVLIHTTTRTLEITGYQLSATWWPLLLNQISRFAVPMFFLISGFVLELNYPAHTNYLSYLKKRLSRLFVPYFFWSLIYYLFVYTKNRASIPAVILSGSAAHQLYFIPSLLLFYLIFPLLHRLYRFLSHPFALLIIGIDEYRLLYQDYFVKNLTLPFPVSIFLLAFFAFIFGMVASHHHLGLTKFVHRFRYLLIAITTLTGAYIFYQGMSRYFLTWNVHAFYSQWRPSVLFYTLSLFSLLYYYLNKLTHIPQAIFTLANLSFFVYFFHLIPLEWLWRIFGTSTAWLYDLVYFLATCILTFGAGYLVRKLPFLSKLTG